MNADTTPHQLHTHLYMHAHVTAASCEMMIQLTVLILFNDFRGAYSNFLPGFTSDHHRYLLLPPQLVSLFITNLCVCCTSCFCKDGYEGDGHSCSAINPCLKRNRGGCDTNVRFALYVCVCLYFLCVCLYSNNCCVDEGRW